LFIDNQSAIAVAKDPEYHSRIKHLDLRTYWLHQTVEDGKIHVSTEMLADLLTKVLPKPKVEYFRKQLGLGPVGDILSGRSIGN